MSCIAIIEDDPLMRALMSEWLTAEGYSVQAVTAEGDRSPADLAIVDVYMPRRLGVERLCAVRSDRPGVPIIAVSGQFQPDVRDCGPAANVLGVDRVIAKPFGREQLLAAVRSVIGPPRHRVA